MKPRVQYTTRGRIPDAPAKELPPTPTAASHTDSTRLTASPCGQRGELHPPCAPVGSARVRLPESYRLQLPPPAPPLLVPVPWKDEGQDIRDVHKPGRSPVSTASARSMGRCGGRSGSARSALSE